MFVGDSALSNNVQACTAPHGAQSVSTHKNKEVQNSYLSYFVDLHPHHVVVLVDSSVEANQHALPLNVLLIDEFQAMIAAHILWHADANDFDGLHKCG